MVTHTHNLKNCHDHWMTEYVQNFIWIRGRRELKLKHKF